VLDPIPPGKPAGSVAGSPLRGGLGRTLALTAALTAAVLLSGVLMLVNAPPAVAHDNVLTGSEPPASATVAEPPPKVVLTFKWPIQPGSPDIKVLGPDGTTQWQQTTTGQVDPTGRSISVDLRELGPAGRYQVQYHGLSGRGYPFQGTVEFTLTQPGPAMLADDLPGGSSGLPLIWVTGVVLLTVAGSAIGVRLGRTP